MSKEKKFRKGKGIKSVTRLPNCLLKLKGKLDSKKGNTVCDAYLNKLMRKCEGFENEDAITAENLLFNDRKEAAVAVNNIKEKSHFLLNKPEIMKSNDTYVIRQNRRNESLISSGKSQIQSSLQRLYIIQENITNIDALLNERIIKTRKKALTKINVYVSGVRSKEIKDYTPDCDFINDAYSIYIDKHSKGDSKINDVIEEQEKSYENK